MTRPAISLGVTAAPVVTIPARQARAFRVIDNRTSELTSWDTDLLPDALSGLNDLDIFSFDDVLPLAVTAGKTDPDDIPETPKNPVTRTGNLWVLGKHRIVCGDSTDQKTVERLLDGAEPDLMVTDPPYGVNYDATWRYKAGVSSKDGAFGKSANDDTSDWQDAYALFPGSIAYVWKPATRPRSPSSACSEPSTTTRATSTIRSSAVARPSSPPSKSSAAATLWRSSPPTWICRSSGGKTSRARKPSKWRNAMAGKRRTPLPRSPTRKRTPRSSGRMAKPSASRCDDAMP